MSHPDEGILQELLDGELPPADAAAVRAHLAGCVPCAVVLRDLAAIQAESDAIVARLPLDPPLVKPAQRVRHHRGPGMRALGLAASVLLVAGTSYMLLRSPSYMALKSADDTTSGLALPMPAEERSEVPATTPSALPAPSAAARAEAGDDQRAKAKSAPRETDAPARQESMKDVAAQAEEPPAKEAEKKEDAGKSGGASAARPANAAAPLTRVAPPAAPAALAFGAAKASEGTMTTLAGAEARIGTKVRTISGLTPLSVEMVPVVADSLLAVRQHYVVSGVPVVLVQQVSTPVSHDTTSFQLRKQSAHDELSDVQSVRSWVAWGSLFQLRGNLPADSLDALMKRVK